MIKQPVGGQDGPLTQAGQPDGPLCLSTGSEEALHTQEQSPANLLHPGQSWLLDDKTPPVVRPLVGASEWAVLLDLGQTLV